jgi:hypothetical protein
LLFSSTGTRIAEFAQPVDDPMVSFSALSYPELRQQWEPVIERRMLAPFHKEGP